MSHEASLSSPLQPHRVRTSRWMGWMGVPAIVLVTGCKALEVAEEPFNDALVTTYRTFDAPDEELAPALRAMERQLYLGMAFETGDLADRAVEPSLLSRADVEHLEGIPDRDPADALAVATGYLSPFGIDEHARIPLLEDQREVEPQSPEHYDREWLDGKACWQPRDCALMETFQNLTKSYSLLGSVEYDFFKDFRWVDLNTGLKGAEPRWAFIARSWNPGSYSKDGDASEDDGLVLWQSYTLELWLPRDGGGFVFSDEDPRPSDRPDAVDSQGDGGTLRLLTLWTETKTPIAADRATEVGTIRWGANQNFEAHDDWLEENPR